MPAHLVEEGTAKTPSTPRKRGEGKKSHSTLVSGWCSLLLSASVLLPRGDICLLNSGFCVAYRCADRENFWGGCSQIRANALTPGIGGGFINILPKLEIFLRMRAGAGK